MAGRRRKGKARLAGEMLAGEKYFWPAPALNRNFVDAYNPRPEFLLRTEDVYRRSLLLASPLEV